MTMPDNNDKQKSWHDSLPFPRQWGVYLAIKIAVLALAVYIFLRWKGWCDG